MCPLNIHRAIIIPERRCIVADEVEVHWIRPSVLFVRILRREDHLKPAKSGKGHVPTAKKTYIIPSGAVIDEHLVEHESRQNIESPIVVADSRSPNSTR